MRFRAAIRATALAPFLLGLASGQQVVFVTGQSYIGTSPGQGYGDSVGFGQALTVDGREGDYFRVKTRDGLKAGYIPSTSVATKDPKAYFVLTIGTQKRNVYVHPLCGVWQDQDRLADFETEIGTTPIALSSIDTMSVTGLAKRQGQESLVFKANVTLKDGSRTSGTFCGADFVYGMSEALQAGEGLELKTGQRVPWTIKAIDKPF